MKRQHACYTLFLFLCLCLALYVALQREPAAAPITDTNPFPIVTFGSYEQDNDPSNGPEPIEWLVLDEKDGQLLLLSRHILDCAPYNELFLPPVPGDVRFIDIINDYAPTSWQACTLRQWLNDVFLKKAFTAAEQQNLRAAALTNPDNAVYGSDGGSDTTDRIFLLSLEEAQLYFTTDEARQAGGTAYALENHAYSDNQDIRPTSVYLDSLSGRSMWWLRSPGVDAACYCFVNYNGNIQDYGVIYDTETIGVRPAVWVDQSAVKEAAKHHE